MFIQLHSYTAAHRYLLDLVTREGEFEEPVAFSAGQYGWPLLRAARRGRPLTVDGVLVRDWNPGNRKGGYSGLRLGARLYELDGVRFAAVHFNLDFNMDESGLSFFAVSGKSYRRLYRSALKALREIEPGGEPPILPDEQAQNLWKNSIGFLESDNLKRIRKYGGRARRGVLLTGPPGNGKTMACRWIWEECRRRNWEYRIITPNNYQQARRGCDAESAIRHLFSVQRRGVIFFDDMDLAIRDRETVSETEDQAVFLTALDGITIKEGVVYVFTTNCPLKLIDRAFKRPGRIDVALDFQPPTPELRMRLLMRWHADIRAGIDLDLAVEDTAGYSFAEMEELRNLLIMRCAETDKWDWGWALDQFAENREDLQTRIRSALGFSLPEAVGCNGDE
ncbi:MAG: ATP-binding protein [Planctomycetes bacterium]|nr:ATP-binding protein [Planctomycetota bacterium]